MTLYQATQLEAEGKIIPYDEMMETLSATENVSSRLIPTTGQHVSFELPDLDMEKFDEMHDTDTLVGAAMSVENTQYPLTKGAYIKALQLIGLRPTYAKKTPGEIIAQNLNYHWTHSGIKGDDVATGLIANGTMLEMVPGNRTVFPTFDIVDTVASAAADRYGLQKSDLRFDYKSQATLDRSALRLIVPDVVKSITTARSGQRHEDQWSIGVDITNSMTGEVAYPLGLTGYMFAWWCTNGSTTTHTYAEEYSKRAIGMDWEDVRDWISDSTHSILAMLPEELNKVEALTRIDLTGEVGSSAHELMRGFNVPISLIDPITDALIESDDMTAYGFMNAVTSAANAEDMDDKKRAKLMAAGGAVTHAMVDRCNTCHRMAL